MEIMNWKSTIAPFIPDYLKDNLNMVATCELTPRLVEIFGMGLIAIVDELKEDNISSSSLTRVTLLFTADGSFSLKEESDNVFGLHFSLSVLIIDRLLKTGEQFQLFAFVEELVHHYWRIEDERETKYKVIKIVNRIDKTLTLDTLKEWGVNWE